jgi:hypothetical protein
MNLSNLEKEASFWIFGLLKKRPLKFLLSTFIQKFQVIEVILYYQVNSHGVIETADATPKDMVQAIIRDNHSTPSAGHTGVRRTINHIKPQYYWPDVVPDVFMFVGRCRLCIKEKTPLFNHSDMPASITI